MRYFGILSLFFMFCLPLRSQHVDSLYGRKVIYDLSGRTLGWYKPDVPGAVYHRVVKLSSEFFFHAPVEPVTGLPMHLVTCCFRGPHMTPSKTFEARRWMHNPACFFAGMVQSLSVQYHAYTGNRRFISIVQEMLDHQLQYGTTPSDFIWPDVPYASSDPFSKIYQGATQWNGERGDGLHGIEPDKVGELGYAYLRFYEITETEKYLHAAISCADALAKNVSAIQVKESSEENYQVIIDKSPWPFRVNAKTGNIIDPYCSNILEPVKLLRELVRIKDRIGLSDERTSKYRNAADIAWNWLFAKNGPTRTFIWNGYFEDVKSDPTLSNRVQITPVELAKYLTEHKSGYPSAEYHVPALLYYALSAFKHEKMDAMNEQLWCFQPMGSHTARFGSACAMWYEKTGNEYFKDLAFRYLNFASYMTHDNGVVSTGPAYSASWFSDGYGDYIRHFLDAMAAVPEWVPDNENHLLRSSSVVQSIEYSDNLIKYKVFDKQSVEKMKLVKKPLKVLAGKRELQQVSNEQTEGWWWDSLQNVLFINHQHEAEIAIHL